MQQLHSVVVFFIARNEIFPLDRFRIAHEKSVDDESLDFVEPKSESCPIRTKQSDCILGLLMPAQIVSFSRYTLNNQKRLYAMLWLIPSSNEMTNKEYCNFVASIYTFLRNMLLNKYYSYGHFRNSWLIQSKFKTSESHGMG